MMTTLRGGIVVLGAALVAGGFVAGCMDQGPGEGADDVELVHSALNDDGFYTVNNAQTALGAGESTTSIMTAWMANDGFGPQVVGEAFGQMSGMPWGSPGVSRIYSINAKAKGSPAVGSEPNVRNFLIAWDEQYSATDSDIEGQVVGDDGRPVGGVFLIQGDGLVEKAPTITYVPQVGQWLVSYTRVNGSTTQLLATWVDFNGNVNGTFTVVPSGLVQSQGKQTVSWCPQSSNLMFTWNDYKVAFAPISTLVAGTVSTVNNAAGLAGTCNTLNGNFAVTWREGANTAAKIGARVLPPGCLSLSCATATNYVIQAGVNSITALNLPVIAPSGNGFGIAAVPLPGSLKRLSMVTINTAGGTVATSTSVVPTCGGTIQGGSMGLPGTIAADTPRSDSSAREFIIYDPNCPTAPNNHKVRITGVLPSNINNDFTFDISD